MTRGKDESLPYAWCDGTPKKCDQKRPAASGTPPLAEPQIVVEMNPESNAQAGRKVSRRPGMRGILGQLFQPAPDVAGRLETAGNARHLAADRDRDALELRHDGERRFVGGVVADEDRCTARKRSN